MHLTIHRPLIAEAVRAAGEAAHPPGPPGPPSSRRRRRPRARPAAARALAHAARRLDGETARRAIA